jgi:hypothetical protein
VGGVYVCLNISSSSLFFSRYPFQNSLFPSHPTFQETFLFLSRVQLLQYSIPLHLSGTEYEPYSSKDDYHQYFGVFRADKDSCKDGKNAYGEKGDCDSTKTFHSLVKDIIDGSKDSFADKLDRSKYLDQLSSFQGSTTAVIVLCFFILIILIAASIPLSIYALGKGMPFGLSDRQGMAITTV